MKRILPIFLVLLALAGFSWAASVGRTRNLDKASAVSGYEAASVTTYRTAALDGGDGVDLDADAVNALDLIGTEGYQTLAVSGTFSAASATCVLSIVRYDPTGYVPTSRTKVTLTADASQEIGTRYLSDVQYVDTGGQPCRILYADPSSGTVTLYYNVQ